MINSSNSVVSAIGSIVSYCAASQIDKNVTYLAYNIHFDDETKTLHNVKKKVTRLCMVYI